MTLRASFPRLDPAAIRARLSQPDGWGPLLVAALDCLVEGAWLAVVYLGMEMGLTRHPAYLDAWTLGVAAAVGLVWARRRPGEPTDDLVLWGLAIAAGVVGTLVAAPALAALLNADPGAAFGAHPMGWLAGAAVLRGSRHADPENDDRAVAGFVAWGLPVLALPWFVGAWGPFADRAAFVAAALPATLLFMGAALLAVGLSRLESLRLRAGVDWQHNRAWLAVAASVIVIMAVVTVPAALLLGEPITLLVATLAAPFVLLYGLVATLAFIIVQPITSFLVGLFHFGGNSGRTLAPQPSSPVGPVIDGQTGASFPVGFAIILGVVLLLAVLVVLWARLGPARERLRAVAAEQLEVRSAAFPEVTLPRPHLTLNRPRRAPRDASGAYLALLHDLAADAERRRLPAESPAAHAARLQARDGPQAALGLLVADFELERYGGARLTSPETRRALGRWRRLRERFRRG